MPTPSPAPTPAAIVPLVVDSELPVTSRRRSTTCGSDAERLDRKKRLTLSTASAAT
jgi:hypothetical protein